ncbi:uncharacterized protein [Haliotis cracherodii]|uniref:uncharacterized protein n=1 Tax=Haliotis cracherodii TaxID=6455 RepID=UPI0039E7BF8D
MPLEFDHPFTALRTVPVVLKNGTKRIRVNALLDDASTKSYINADVASELGMQGSIEKISVSVLNGKKETFETKPVVFGIESEDELKTPLTRLIPDDEQALHKAQETLVYMNGQYQIGIPWKNVPSLPNDYAMAFRRLLSTEKKLSKDKDTALAYDNIILQYVEKGYIHKVDHEESREDVWYLPHFPILRPDKTTTKVRIVFDASAKYQDTSLNDVISPGPKLHSELFDVLIRFRRKPVALICDIAEMFLQIKISPEDRPYHRFLWRSMNTDMPPEVYEFSRLVFGNTSSPFLAQYVTQEHAKAHLVDLPMAAETVIKSTYMDDSMDSVENVDEGIELYNQLTQLWSSASMHARKWLSNSLNVLDNIPEEDRASEIDLCKGHLPSVKALGLMWVAEKDMFTFKVGTFPEEETTKRGFLRQIARLFDPLGFIGPFIITAKILLQEMWLTGHDWDDELPQNLQQKIEKWLVQWKEVQGVQVPRCLRLDAEICSVSIHTFVDASQDAYGTVVYAIYTYMDGKKSSRIVAAKSRVAPLKACSIPRLELMAAVLGLRLVSEVVKVLQIEIETVTFWSDSRNVLCWIRNNSRTFKPFVGNRVGEIHSTTNPSQWRHVPSAENPADHLTRGLSVSQLIHNELWWSGPTFLLRDESEWPSDKAFSLDIINDDERRTSNKQVALVSIQKPDLATWRLDPSRFSSWRKLTRVNAWIFRFLHNCSTSDDYKMKGELTVEEIADSEHRIIADAQTEAFASEYATLLSGKMLASSSKLLALQPQLDENGVMRLSGRLGDAECLPLGARFPIILPRRSWVTKLIIKQYHEDGKHVLGTNQTLAAVSSKYWIISAREAIREWEKECARCNRDKAKPAYPMMAPLPKMRLRKSFRAFSQAAVDYAGPFITVQGRGKSRQKRYLCLFTCLTTRAVHLEMAYSLDTSAFLNAFYRMVNRRGLPQDVISDNGTNFVGAVKELKELLHMLDQDAVRRSMANRGVKWHFNPPYSPHFGGVFETMIKSAKRAIFAILGNGDVTDEELETAFTGAEALINSRPLTYQSTHPQDEIPLTPNHFLHGQIGGMFAPESVDTTDYHPRKRWRRIQELMRHFWKRWMKEWLPGLNPRRKWRTPSRDLCIDDVVLVISPDTPRGQWPLGRIVKTYPGRDGHVRVVDVRIGQSVITRAANKICPLEWSTVNCDFG